MGGDFQFDPRLKRHRIFTAAATVLCLVSQSKGENKKKQKNTPPDKTWASSNLKDKHPEKHHAMHLHKVSLKESRPCFFHFWPFIFLRIWQVYKIKRAVSAAAAAALNVSHRPVGLF